MPVLLALLSLAVADDAVSLRAVRTVTFGQDAPSVTIDSRVVGHVRVQMRCGAKAYTLNTRVTPGGSYTLTMDGLPSGDHTCSGTLTLEGEDGSSGQLPLDLRVSLRKPPVLSVRPEDLNLDEQTLMLRADRPLDDIQVDVFGPENLRIGGSRTPAGGRSEVAVSWSSHGEVVRIDVRATDDAGIGTLLELIPWAYAIPHEDVVFETNSAEIRPSEQPKLEKAWHELERVVAKYGSVVQVQLFVAGYTDTVGSASSNQALSERRARSIASWFRARGFKEAIFFQGFGESALAVSTPDETAEAANRRAIYILAARPPVTSHDIPHDHWKKL
jgi:hypothetical protein